MPPIRNSLNRRQAMMGSVAGLSAAALPAMTLGGCGGDSNQQTADTSEAAPRTNIPIRVVWCGTDGQAETLRRGWSSVSEQSIDIEVIPLDRTDPSTAIDAIIAAAGKSDLIGTPLASIAELTASGVIVPLVGDELKAGLEQLFPALRSGVSQFASESYSMPISATLPAVITNGPAGPLDRWADYDAWVDKEAKGQSGEPTTDGWAATMLLWRASGATNRWLLDRESGEPLIAEDAYVEALAQMVQTVGRYEQPMQTPSQIWTGIESGRWVGGVCFPTQARSAESDLQVASLPAESDVAKLLFDPFSNVMAFSANCRQSDVSRAFLNWISGGNGSRSTRQQIAPESPVRIDAEDSTPSPYGVWLANQLQSPLTLPSMQMLSAGRYHAALNEAVVDALEGKSKPAEALATAAKTWSAINESVGIDKQIRAWRRAQGMRA